MTNTNFAGAAGRITGTAFAHARRTAALIDWAEVGQIVIHGIVTIAVVTYLAGEFTGRTLHRLNDQLAALWRRLWVPGCANAPIEPAMVQTHHRPLVPPAAHPLALIADELMLHTRRELNAITGLRGKAAKHQLVAAYVAA